jgi:phosphopantetheinyl transferase
MAFPVNGLPAGMSVPFSPVPESHQYPGKPEFIPIFCENNHSGCQVYQVKITGKPEILGEIWDFKPAISRRGIDNIEILDEGEISRADRILNSCARNNFVTRHVLLRTILSRYLLIPPKKIGYSYNPWGRPFIAGNGDSGRIFFNMSHTEGRVLIAVSQHLQPGIDCETINSGTEIMGIAGTYFHQDVADYLALLGSGDRRYQFFRTWVHFEACLKAFGTGLSQSPGILSFPHCLPVPQLYMLNSPGHPGHGVIIGMDFPSECNSVAACAFHLPPESSES